MCLCVAAAFVAPYGPVQVFLSPVFICQVRKTHPFLVLAVQFMWDCG